MLVSRLLDFGTSCSSTFFPPSLSHNIYCQIVRPCIAGLPFAARAAEHSPSSAEYQHSHSARERETCAVGNFQPTLVSAESGLEAGLAPIPPVPPPSLGTILFHLHVPFALGRIFGFYRRITGDYSYGAVTASV